MSDRRLPNLRPVRLVMPNLRQVRVRTALGAALALTAVLAVSLAAIGLLVTRQVRASADTALREQAGDRARLLDDGADAGSLVNVVGDEVVVVVIGPDGDVLASAGTPEPDALATVPTGLSEVEIVVFDDDDGDVEAPHEERLRAAVAVASTGGRVIVADEGEQAGRTIAATWTILAVAGPLIALVGAVLAWLVTGRALAPVHRLRRELQEVVDHGLEARVSPPGTEDEIDGLAHSVNEVLGRLERLAAVRRRFVADASHELKSPIANARALLETGEVDGQRTALLGELNRLQSLVDDLLFLARTDETSTTEPIDFDLDDVVFDEAERATIRAATRIDASAVRPARVRGDRQEVARAIRNLLENAVQHADAAVAVGIVERPDRWVVTVTDDGPGIPPGDRDRIFERFARLDGDRSRRQGGTGLGLSIVATIADRNGGTVSVTEPGGDGRGTRFELALPPAST